MQTFRDLLGEDSIGAYYGALAVARIYLRSTSVFSKELLKYYPSLCFLMIDALLGDRAQQFMHLPPQLLHNKLS